MFGVNSKNCHGYPASRNKFPILLCNFELFIARRRLNLKTNAIQIFEMLNTRDEV